MSILEVNNVSKSFGGVKANVDISMSVDKGKIVGLIGPNGSGKTTLFNSIVGTYPIDQGSIKFNSKEVSELPVPVIAKLGLLRTFQQTRIYGKLNCIENMLISHKASDESFIKIFSSCEQVISTQRGSFSTSLRSRLPASMIFSITDKLASSSVTTSSLAGPMKNPPI